MFLDLESLCGCEPDRSEHSQLVFVESGSRIADRPQDSRFKVGASADEIDDLLFRGIVEQTVDGEIASLGIGGRSGKLNTVRPSPVGIIAIAAERCDFGGFDLIVVRSFPARSFGQNSNHPERGTKGQRAIGAEDFSDRIWRGVCRDVVIFGRQLQQSIAHASTCEIGGVACFC